MRWPFAILLGLVGCCVAAIAPGDVKLKVEFEDLGPSAGLTLVETPQASGGKAVVLGTENTGALGAVQLAAGDYTLLLWSFCDGGDQDHFFLEIDGERTRVGTKIKAWQTVAVPFKVKQAGLIGLRFVGQEQGFTIDQVAVVRGTLKNDEVAFASLPGDVIPGADTSKLPRRSGPCALRELPEQAFEPNPATVLLEHFEALPKQVEGDASLVDGKFGQAVYLPMPDGAYRVDVSQLKLGATGTVEYWVRPRPGERMWHDQGWHYFLHLASATPGGFQLDLSRHIRTNLRLTASLGLQPFDQGGEPREEVRINTNSLDLEAWHHLLVSWDLRGEQQVIWLLVDGLGQEQRFKREYPTNPSFSRLDLVNRPQEWEVPYLALDGAIDELRILNTSVADRLTPQ